MNFQLHYPWIHDFIVEIHKFASNFGPEFPSIYTLVFFGMY